MPIVPVEAEVAGRGVLGGPPAPDPTGDPIAAAFRQSNTLVSMLADLRNGGTFAPEPGYNPLDEIKGTPYFESHPYHFAASRSPAETQSIMRQINQENADRRLAGPIGSLMAGSIDPTWFIGYGAGSKAGQAIKSTFMTGARDMAVLTAKGLGAQEAMLGASQQTRTAEESVGAVTSGTLLWAFLGGAAGKLLAREGRLEPVTGLLNLDRDVMKLHATGEPMVVRAAPETKPSTPEWDGYHGTDVPTDFGTNFDLNMEKSRSGFPRGAEKGVAFFSPTPELANDFAGSGRVDATPGQPGPRVIPVKINPGKTATFDAVKLWAEDEAFHDEIRKMATTFADPAMEARNTPEQKSNLERIHNARQEDIRRQYDFHTKGFYEAAQQFARDNPEADLASMVAKHESQPFKLPTNSGALAAIIERAKKQGLDTAYVTGLKEGDQILVLNGQNIRPKFSEAPRPDSAVPAGEPVAVGAGSAGSIGAAAADTRQVELAPSFGVGKVTAGFDPMSRSLNAASVETRRTAADLAETPLLTKENLQGIPTTSGPALERSARMAINQTRVAVGDTLDRLWKDLRFGGEAAPWFAREREALGLLNRPPELPTFAQFKEMISQAMQEGDTHAIPQVQEAAQFIRKTVFEPWKERAIEAKLLPEGVDVKTADSYLQRIYNKQAIQAKRPEFVNVVQSWLKSDQGTKAAAKDRLQGLSDELTHATSQMSKAKSQEDFLLASTHHDEVRTRMENELTAWEGKSSSEAKSAIKAREKYARESGVAFGEKHGVGAGRPESADRLKAADKAVDDAVKAIIAKDRDLSDAELRDRAHEITERILGTADGRLPYDIASGGPEIGYRSGGGESARGPLHTREFNIPDASIREFLEKDIEHIVAAHLRTMVPDVLLTERFGDVRMTERLKKIEDDYARLIDQTKSEKDRTALGKERDAALRDIAAMRDRIRGVYGQDVANSMRGAARTAAAVKNYNVLASMGMAAVSSLPDMAGIVFRHGLGTVFNDAWAPFVRSLMSDRALTVEATRQFRAMGIAIETTLAQRQHALTDVMDSFRPQSRLERTLQWGADKFQMVNMLGPWTDIQKTIAATVASQEIFRAAKALGEGKATARQVRSLAENGIDQHMAAKIADQYAASGNKVDGVHLPNTESWTDRAAREAFDGAVSREADIAVVTPGQEKPLWLSNPIVSVVGQFKSFTAASTQRILIANLQRRDAQVLQGLLASLALGMVSYKVNSMLGGQKTSDRPQDWIKESISRGGLLGWFEEGNAMASKMTRGGLDVYRMIGANKPLSRYAGRTVIDQLLGPTAGKIEALSKVTGAAGSMDWNASDTSALRKVTAFQNVFFLRSLFNQVEAGANSAFGIPVKPQ